MEKIYETRNYLLDEIKHNNMISKKHNNVCRAFFFFFFAFVSAVSGCASISVFPSLVGVSVDIKSKRQLSRGIGKHNKTVLLAKAKLNTFEVLLFQ